jgi:uncharacterized membrane-anchored protein
MRILRASLSRSLVLKYVAITALPLFFLLFRPVVSWTVLLLGERVLLRTLPVDPRDFLKGDYVILDYEIAHFPTNSPEEEFPSGRRALDGETLYVSLVLDGAGVASVDRVSAERPSEGLYLEGSLRSSWRGNFSVDYGLGAYYVREGTGRGIEETISAGEVLADVRVFRGRGVIRTLELPKERAEEGSAD